MLEKLGIKSEFKQGLRVTDAATVDVVEMVLTGSVKKEIVGYISREGGKAIGLCGKDGNMVLARKATRTIVDPDSKIEQVLDHYVKGGTAPEVLKAEISPIQLTDAERADLIAFLQSLNGRHDDEGRSVVGIF